jgi:predicted lipoprotein with Yx(FWY)xxD motif
MASIMVKSRHLAKFGDVLTNAAGDTLYVFTEDKKGMSSCNGGCASAWPPLLVPSGESLTGMPGLGTIKRSDGDDQAALHGKALYTFAADKKPGQTHGQGSDGDWFVMTTSGVSHVDADKAKGDDDGDDDGDSDGSSHSSDGGGDGDSSPSPTPASGGGYGY